MTRGAKRGKDAKPSSLTLSPTLLYALLAAVGLLAGGSLSLAAYSRYLAAREARDQALEEVQRLRPQARAVAVLRQEVSALEERFRSLRWPDPPEKGGTVWLARELARRGWSLKHASVGEAKTSGELVYTPVTVAVERVTYSALIEGLEAAKARQVRGGALKLSADAEGVLTGHVVFNFMAPANQPPGGGPGGGGP